MSSAGEYKTVEDVISDLNVMIVEAPIPNHIAMILANVVGELGVQGEFVEDVFELAFGDDAINKGYTCDEVLVKLKEFSDKALEIEDE